MAGSEEGNGFRQLELETELGKAGQEGGFGVVPDSSFRLHLIDTSTFLSPLAASTRPKRVFMKKWTRDKGDGVGHELLPGTVFPPTPDSKNPTTVHLGEPISLLDLLTKYEQGVAFQIAGDLKAAVSLNNPSQHGCRWSSSSANLPPLSALAPRRPQTAGQNYTQPWEGVAQAWVQSEEASPFSYEGTVRHHS